MAHFGTRTFGARLAVVAAAVALALAGCGGAQSRKQHFLARGREYLAQGHYEKARVEFRNALQVAPNDAEARFENGVAAENLATYADAARFYEGALDIQPDHLEARRNLARLLFLGGLYQVALDTIRPGLEKHPDDSVLLAIRAGTRSRMLPEKADLSEPVADAERAVRIDPHNTEGVQILAGLYARQNRAQDVLKVFQQGVADNPRSIPMLLLLADRYNANQRPEEAEKLVRQTIALAPANAAYRINLARFYGSRDRIDDAEATLRQGVKELPKNPLLTQELFDFLRVRRSTAVAEQEVRALQAANPDDEELSFTLAGLFVAERQTDKAREVLRSVIARRGVTKPARLHAQCSLAIMQLEANDVPGAQNLIKKVLDEDERYSEALELRARIALLRQRPQDAIGDLRTVLKDQPSSVSALRLLSLAHTSNHEPALALEVLQRAVDANPNDNALVLDLVQLLMSQGKPGQAQPLAEQLAQREPRNPVFLRAAFQAQLGNKDLAAATHTADYFVQTLPQRADGYYLAGLAAAAGKDTPTAISRLEKAQEIAPTAHEPLGALVRLYAGEGKVGPALERLDRFARAQPKDPFPRTLAGELLMAQGKLPEAAGMFRAAIALAPKELPSYQGLARVQFMQKDVEGAIRTLRGAQIQVAVPEAAALDLASVYQNAGRTNDAVSAYDEALRLNPQFDVAANELAMLLVTRGNDQASLDRALTVAQRFANSTNPYYIDTLAWVRFKRGETTTALPLLMKAVDWAPGDETLRYHLAMAQLKAGQNETARDNLRQALKTGRDFEGAGEARTALAGLQASAAAPPH